jgi:hypothetical protein
MEGEGYNAKLLRDGKAVALVDDDGCGGCLRISWNDRAETSVPISVESYDGRTYSYMGSPEEALLVEHCKGLPPVMSSGEGMKQDVELFIAMLAGEALTLRDMRRALKKKTLFAVGDKLYEIKGTGADVLTYVVTKYPAARVLNALPEHEAFALYKPKSE